jgi:tetratricopeptide (TPR) repeat protein
LTDILLLINQVLSTPFNQLIAGTVVTTTLQGLYTLTRIHTLPSTAINAIAETAKHVAQGDLAQEKLIRDSLMRWLESDALETLAKRQSATENIATTDLLANFREHASQVSELQSAQILTIFLIMFEAERALNDPRFNQQIQALHRFQMTKLLESKGSDMGVVLDSDSDFELEPRLKEIKTLIDTEHILAAQELLAKLANDLNAGTKSSVRQLFHMYSGICHLRRENFVEGRTELELATKIDPKTSLPWVNLAHLEFAEENISDALKHSTTAFDIDPMHKSIITTHLMCLLAASEEERYRLLIAQHPDIEASEEFQLLQARVMLDREDYQQAVSILKPFIDAETTHSSAYFMMARALFGPLRERVLQDPPITGQLPDFDQQLLAEILKYEDRSVDLLKAFEHREPIAISLVNRGAIKSYMQDVNGAIEDCKLALHYDPTRDNARINLARAYIILNRFEEAEDILSRVGPALLGEAAFLYIEIHCRREDWAKAEPYLENPYCNDKTHPLYVVTLSRRIEIKKHLGHSAQVQETVRLLETLVETQPEAAYVLAHAHGANGDLKEAIHCLRECKERSQPNIRLIVTSFLADCLYESGKYLQAADQYCEIVDKTSPNHNFNNLICAQKEAGLFHAARVNAALFRKVGGDKRFLHLELANLTMEQAAELLVQICAADPDDVTAHINLAALAGRLHQSDRYAETIEKLDCLPLDADERKAVDKLRASHPATPQKNSRPFRAP